MRTATRGLEIWTKGYPTPVAQTPASTSTSSQSAREGLASHLLLAQEIVARQHRYSAAAVAWALELLDRHAG